jgi:hypothetical protein
VLSSLSSTTIRPNIIQLETITRALREKPSLHVYFQLDLNRSTRPGPASTAKLLLPLLEEFPTKVHTSMFRSPSLRGFMAKIVPPRFNEGWGTWHAKVYGVDNELIISGCACSFSCVYLKFIVPRVEQSLAQTLTNLISRIAKTAISTSTTSPYLLSIASTFSRPSPNFPSVCSRFPVQISYYLTPSSEMTMFSYGQIPKHIHTIYMSRRNKHFVNFSLHDRSPHEYSSTPMMIPSNRSNKS